MSCLAASVGVGTDFPINLLRSYLFLLVVRKVPIDLLVACNRAATCHLFSSDFIVFIVLYCHTFHILCFY